MLAAFAIAVSSCNDFLDVTPPSDVSPDVYFRTAEQLGNYTLNYYTAGDSWDADGNGGCLPFEPKGGDKWKGSASIMNDDLQTDNENSGSGKSVFNETNGPKVKSEGGVWDFYRINELNYFIRTVSPLVANNQVSGDPIAVKHYLGEGHFLRASEYFFRMRKLGDMPIITHTLPLDRDKLAQASARRPRNLVARFILQDLDTAIWLLSDGARTGGKNRITRDAALLLKARVALYEATFEKYFAGTPFVPDASAGWPGAQKGYNKNFSYDNQTEVNFFLDQAMAAAKEVADAHPLTSNNKRMIGATEFATTPGNDYYNMFAGTDASGYDEVIMWHQYGGVNEVRHGFNNFIRSAAGYTHEFQNAFLMESGKPIYAAGDEYKGDDFVEDTKVNRDWRWRLFMKAPGEYLYENSSERHGFAGKKGSDGQPMYVPKVFIRSGNYTSATGYCKGKMFSTNIIFGDGSMDETNLVVMRAAEAYLIYMEACWERKGDNLDSDAWDYWSELRKRAGVGSPQTTIDATDLNQEWALTKDLGMYSGGNRIQSKVLYNIRRERRCEFISEGRRMDDLIRWRSLDQLCNPSEPYFVHGCKIHGPMKARLQRESLLKYGQSKESDNTVSNPADIDGALNGDARYNNMFRISKDNSEWYATGMTWRMAHYLSPIAVNHFLESSPTGSDIENSPIYQNPYWGTVAQTSAQK